MAALIDTWNAAYANHASLRTLIEFAHIAGLVAGGGCALAADLATVRAAGLDPAERGAELRFLKRMHPVVVWGLVAVLVSGVLLLAADVDTYLYSRIFWLKMALVAALLVNGALLWRGERRVANGDVSGWTTLHYTAVASLLLWLVTTLAGAALPNLG
jgi:hypothetical protein